MKLWCIMAGKRLLAFEWSLLFNCWLCLFGCSLHDLVNVEEWCPFSSLLLWFSAYWLWWCLFEWSCTLPSLLLAVWCGKTPNGLVGWLFTSWFIFKFVCLQFGKCWLRKLAPASWFKLLKLFKLLAFNWLLLNAAAQCWSRNRKEETALVNLKSKSSSLFRWAEIDWESYLLSLVFEDDLKRPAALKLALAAFWNWFEKNSASYVLWCELNVPEWKPASLWL